MSNPRKSSSNASNRDGKGGGDDDRKDADAGDGSLDFFDTSDPTHQPQALPNSRSRARGPNLTRHDERSAGSDEPGDGKADRKGARGDSHTSTGADASQSKDNDEDDDKQKGEEEDDSAEPSPQEQAARRKKMWIIGAIAAGVLVIGLIVGIPWWLHARHFESTDDAFIDAHVQKLAPQVSGRVTRVRVADNQLVHAGDTLVEIDAADFRVAAEQAKASIEQANARIAEAQAQKLVASANVEQTAADVEQADVNAQNARTELARYERLSAEAVSRQRLDDLRTASRNADAQLKAMQKKLVATRAQVEVAAAQEQAARAGIGASQAQLDNANLQLSYIEIKASVDGRVTQLELQVGDYVRTGQQLMILVPHDVWVTANFKETQLADMRVGQPVTIEVDAYPDVEFRGKIDSIQKGSGAWFSLLPPENATGNYVKVVQRVPVKITFDDTSSDEYRRLAPGTSVAPKVRVR